MNVGEFKQAVWELKQSLIRQKDEEVVSLITQLSALLQDLSDDAPVYAELMVETRLIFDQFGTWVIKNLAPKKWHLESNVKPWLVLQKKLSEAGLLTSNYHRTVIYSVLAKQYLSSGREQLGQEDNALLAYTSQLFYEEFASSRNNVYSTALIFAAAIKEQVACLVEKEVHLIQDALYTFCLHVYEEEQRHDQYPSPFSLSGKTKCNAAEKKRQALAGFPIKYGLFEVIALKQGRLGALVDMFEGR